MARYEASYDFDQSPDRIYAIFRDIELMHEFIPLCKRSRVVQRGRDPAALEVVSANFLLRYRRVNYEQSFDLRFTYWPAVRRLKVEPAGELGSGTSLVTVTSNGGHGCRVLLESNFKFKSLAVRWLMPKRLFIEGLNRIMESVRQRAEELHHA